jgi:AraC-like DNA-binding protein
MRESHASLGLTANFGTPTKMRAPHAHDDIELNLLLSGSMEYVLNGKRLVVEPNRLLAFWAAIPHEVIQAQDAKFIVVTIPLTRFMAWSQTCRLLNQMLYGRPFVGQEDPVTVQMVQRWPKDLSSPVGDPTAALLEIQATLVRLANDPVRVSLGQERQDAVDRMRRFVAERYTEEVTIDQIAQYVGMHPNHAMRVFKKATGTTLGDCILLYRLAHAKRLLAMTDLILPIVTVQSGFGSERRLFEVFREQVGMSPNRYRRAARHLSSAL